MFTTTPFNVRSQENNNLLAKKAGMSNVSSRKPLQDRSVNEKTTEKKSNIKEITLEKKVAKTNLNNDWNPEGWNLDICSYKEVEDNYEDIWPKPERLSKLDVCKILKTFNTDADEMPATPPSPAMAPFPLMYLDLVQEEPYFMNDFVELDVSDPDLSNLTFEDVPM